MSERWRNAVFPHAEGLQGYVLEAMGNRRPAPDPTTGACYLHLEASADDVEHYLEVTFGTYRYQQSPLYAQLSWAPGEDPQFAIRGLESNYTSYDLKKAERAVRWFKTQWKPHPGGRPQRWAGYLDFMKEFRPAVLDQQAHDLPTTRATLGLLLSKSPQGEDRSTESSIDRVLRAAGKTYADALREALGGT